MKRSDLRYLRLSHIDENGQEHIGEMVCNKQIAQPLLRIFSKLYEARYPIHSICLIDDFEADDEKSMTENNTSCFCFRTVSGTNVLSKHARNKIKGSKASKEVIVNPTAGAPYADRSRTFQMKINRSDLAYKLFRKEGFTWGGDWRSSKDYQHFEQ